MRYSKGRENEGFTAEGEEGKREELRRPEEEGKKRKARRGGDAVGGFFPISNPGCAFFAQFPLMPLVILPFRPPRLCLCNAVTRPLVPGVQSEFNSDATEFSSGSFDLSDCLSASRFRHIVVRPVALYFARDPTRYAVDSNCLLNHGSNRLDGSSCESRRIELSPAKYNIPARCHP